ncbi:gamma-glutamyltransferase [Micromonospora sp. NPDC049679]|uniref:gamma-glutamyltransferase family protein n=1 Tax=Micromonospora sp. NPDC049679 TaxID=3155920 RepID=UPI0033FFEEB9
MSARKLRYFIPTLVATLGLAAVVIGPSGADTVSSRADGCKNPKGRPAADATGKKFMVAAANPLAVEAGCSVLAKGGSAVDAAVAVQAVLTVVEPHASGLAGGTLITYWDADKRTVRFFDGLARAPKSVARNLKTPTDQERKDFGVNRFPGAVSATGRAFGVPGTVRVLSDVHELYGALRWDQLFDDAIGLAAGGFPMPPNLHAGLGERVDGSKRCDYADLRVRYCHGDTPKPVGATLYNDEVAEVLREIRQGGADAFYDPNGKIAPAIVERAGRGPFKLVGDKQGPAVIPSLMTVDDFADYRAVERDRVCGDVFRVVVCSSAPPAFGGVTVLEMLGMLDRGEVQTTDPGSAKRTHLSLEASRLANFDRRAYIGDPDYRKVPVAGLLNSGYLDKRFSLFSGTRAIHPVRPGKPAGAAAPAAAPSADASTQDGGNPTSNMSIVDADGNAVSMTTTINSHFGSHLEARGMILNDAQNNFTDTSSISPGKGVNVMEPRKRPAAAMAPTVVLDREAKKLKLVVGAAGGGHIPDYVTQTLVGVIVDDMGPAEAIAQGHYSGQEITGNCQGVIGVPSELETQKPVAGNLAKLKARGHPCARVVPLNSGITAIEVRGNRLIGAADPRRDGTALGR